MTVAIREYAASDVSGVTSLTLEPSAQQVSCVNERAADAFVHVANERSI
jgi:hypothetical protein